MKQDNKSQFFPKTWAKYAKTENIANPYGDEAEPLRGQSNENTEKCSGTKIAFCCWVR
jgi:hypothetical protein